MANYYGTPAIVTDGLVFAIDAGNGQSYVSGSGNCFSLIGNITGSLSDDNGSGMYSSDNQGTWVFDGVDDYIDCGNITLLNGLQNASWEFWAKSSDDGGYVLSQWGSGTDAQFYTTVNPSATFIDFYLNGTISIRTYSAPLVVDTWYHFCFTYDDALAGSVALVPYINSVEIARTGFNATGFINSSTTNLHIGKRTDLTSGEWLGNIASVKIYNKTLSASEILQNYNATKNRFI